MNKLNNSVGYQGEVAVRLSNSKDIPIHLHNAGFKPLWNALAKAMAGYPIADEVPTYFSVYKRTGSPDTGGYSYEDCLLKHIQFVGPVWGDAVEKKEESTSVRFTVTVTKRDRRITVDSNSVAVLRMFSRSGEVLAEVEDNIDKVIAKSHNSMITGVDAIYEWKMTFKNVTTDDSSGGSK